MDQEEEGRRYRTGQGLKKGCITSVGDIMGGFFFQAEDGIRDRLVTGVQTCALPI